MSKLVYLLILVGAAIIAFGAKEVLTYSWDSMAEFEVGAGIVVIVAALVLSGATRWR